MSTSLDRIHEHIPEDSQEKSNQTVFRELVVFRNVDAKHEDRYHDGEHPVGESFQSVHSEPVNWP
jgi:hypothetical protein